MAAALELTRPEHDGRFEQLDGLGLLLLAADWARSERWMGDILRDIGGVAKLGGYVDVLEQQARKGSWPLTGGVR